MTLESEKTIDAWLKGMGYRSQRVGGEAMKEVAPFNCISNLLSIY